MTCDDFLASVVDANPGSDLERHCAQFGLWYAQAGTPHVSARGQYDAMARTFTLTLHQMCAATPGQPDKPAQVIPVRIGLLDAAGNSMRFGVDGAASTDEALLVLTEPQQSFVLHDVSSAPVPSLLRGFSAPVVLDDGLDDAQRLVLLGHDPDAFNRWEASQRLALARLLPAARGEASPEADDAWIDALRNVLCDPALSPAFKELVLTLPGEGIIAEQLDVTDPARIRAARQQLRLALARRLQDDWEQTWYDLAPLDGYAPDFTGSGRRALRNLALAQLCHLGDAQWQGRAYQLVKDADNMTDRFAALGALVSSSAPLAEVALARFATQFAHEPLVMDKWFALQASAPGATVSTIEALMQHPDFSLRNPNRARSVISTFCQANPGSFHRADGEGYAFWATQVRALDALNPQVAARLARALDRWRKLATPYAAAAELSMRALAAHPGLSPDTHEILDKALA